jgi:hypothetical protein
MSQNITVLGAVNSPISVRIVQVDNDGQALALHDASTFQTVDGEDTLHSRLIDGVKVEAAENVVLAEILPVTMEAKTPTATSSHGSQISSGITSSENPRLHLQSSQIVTPSQGSQISSPRITPPENPRSHLPSSQTTTQVATSADTQQTSTNDKSTSRILVSNEKLNGNSVALVEVDAVSTRNVFYLSVLES